MEVNIIDNKEKKRFEFKIEDNLSFVEYIVAQDKIYLTHTEVPKELEGKGIASEMIKQIFKKIKEENLKLIPLCPFVAGYIKNHPKYKELLAKGYNV